MSRVDAFKCDRCKVLREGSPTTTITLPAGKMELCGSCETKLQKFMDGDELEEPP